jgi:hypothetical protein
MADPIVRADEFADDVLDLSGPLAADTPDAAERRVTVRAYAYWASLLAGREFPSARDLDPGDIEEFRDTSLLLDFSVDPQNPTLLYVGPKLRDDAGVQLTSMRPSDVPGRSLISRLTDHYLEIIANRAPVGFEAEFTNARGQRILYRGILMPLSDDGQTINFLFGVLSWKTVGSPAMAREPVTSFQPLAPRAEQATPAQPTPPKPVATSFAAMVDAAADDDDRDDALELSAPLDAPADDDLLDLGNTTMLADPAPELRREVPEADNAYLASVLSQARTAAEQVRSVDHRSRAALYSALAQAYAFHVEAMRHPDDYAALLSANGLTVQERAPFTPTVKLVFGADYDKTRLTEYAAALSYATREGVAPDAFKPLLDAVDGGLKAVVAAERAQRNVGKGNEKHDKLQAAADVLRAAPALATLTAAIETDGAEFVLLLARRRDDGLGFDVIAPVPATQAVLDGAVQRTGKLATRSVSKKTR